MLAKVLATVASTIIHPPTVIVLPPIPLDAFNVCAVAVDLRPMLIPCSIGTAFGTWSRSPRFWAPMVAERGVFRDIRVSRHNLVHVSQ